MVRRLLPVAFVVLSAASAHAFCGFYVAKGDAKIFNRASQVVLVRDADRTVMTMANDFRGEPKEFAVVIPVPTFTRMPTRLMQSHGQFNTNHRIWKLPYGGRDGSIFMIKT